MSLIRRFSGRDRFAVALLAVGAAASALLLAGTGAASGDVAAEAASYVEDFNGTALNGDAWIAYNSPTSTKPQGPKCSCNAIVHDGMLTLRVAQVNGVWTGAGVYSKVVHSTYGRVAIRARYGHGYGAKAVALWWPESKGTWPPEIDFMEYSASDANHSEDALTNHYGATNSQQHDYVRATPGWHRFVMPSYDSSEWHTYAVDWEPDAITYSVDGVVVAVQAGHSPDIRMWLGMQNSLGRTAATKPNATTPAAVDFDVDWVRFYAPTG